MGWSILRDETAEFDRQQIKFIEKTKESSVATCRSSTDTHQINTEYGVLQM